ncbi:MAG TPA: hypothetical protein VGN05_07065 [Parvibaculum sp.]
MSMRKPLIYSAAVHVAILVATIVALPTRELDPVQTRALPVELLTVAEMTNLKRQAKKHVDQPKPVETPKPKPEPEKPKAAPTPEPKAEPTPAPPEPEEKAEPIPDKKAEKKPEEKKPEPPKPEKQKPSDKKPDKPKKKSFDPSKIAALLNKIPDAASQPDEAKPTEEKADAPETDDPDAKMTVSELDALRQKINQCFNTGALAGTIDADKMFADVSFSLNEDGSVAGQVSIDKTGPGSSRLLAEYARTAILKCAPYDKLPRDKFNDWRDVTGSFTLSGMM